MGDETVDRTFTPAAHAALAAFPIEARDLTLVSLSENVTFRVTDGRDGRAPDSGFSTSPDHLTTSAPVPIGKLPDHERLTPRESEVLTYLSKGFTIKEIASLMGIKWFTVNDHIKSIYKKLNVSSRAEAAVLATKQGRV